MTTGTMRCYHNCVINVTLLRKRWTTITVQLLLRLKVSKEQEYVRVIKEFYCHVILINPIISILTSAKPYKYNLSHESARGQYYYFSIIKNDSDI